MSKQSILDNPWYPSIAAGILLGLSFPPVNLPFLQIPAFILLFRVAEQSGSWRQLCLYAYASFVIWNTIATYWLIMATVSAGITAILANAFLMLIPLCIIRLLFKMKRHPLLLSFLAASVWTSYEFLHHNWDLSWTWLTLGNGWANFPSLIQYISITGYLAISFWVILVSAILYTYIKTRERSWLTGSVIILFIFPIFSLIVDTLYEPEVNDPIEVAVVQPNMDSYLDYGGLNNLGEVFTVLLDLSDSARTDQTQVIIWPENAIDTNVAIDSPYLSRLDDIFSEWNTQLISGAGYIEYYETPEDEPYIVRRRQDGIGYNIFNSAIHINPDADEPGVYKKGRLVPVVERLPFANFLKRLDIFGWVDWGPITVFGKGEAANNFDINGNPTSALVCYDSIFPGWAGQFVRNGATFLTIITNDGWWGNTSGHHQHFAYARLRAIEFRRWVVRSANNGISGIISPDGTVHVKTDYWKRTAFTSQIIPQRNLTFYARNDNWFNWLMLAGTGFGLVIIVQNRRKNTPMTLA